MNSVIDTKVDRKNIGFMKILYQLRQDLDIHCLLVVNADKIEKHGVGKNFFAHIQRLIDKSISINICKIYESEKKFELNSIQGIVKSLVEDNQVVLNEITYREFIQKYANVAKADDHISNIKTTIQKFRKEYRTELDNFKKFRDKVAAHYEHDFLRDERYQLPSYDTMEKLFYFGVDFYKLISDSFVGVVPYDLKNDIRVKSSLKRLLQKMGIEDVKTDFDD